MSKVMNLCYHAYLYGITIVLMFVSFSPDSKLASALLHDNYSYKHTMQMFALYVFIIMTPSYI